MIGFALVFVLTAVALSLAAIVAIGLAGDALERRGPHVERRAVELAAALPVTLALALVVTLVIRAHVGDDHCRVHDHHAHLCAVHGDAWLRLPWAMVAIAAAAATLLARGIILVGQHVRGARAIAAMSALASVDGDVRLVDSPRAFCFVAGLWRSQIYASTAAWHELAEDERAAMLAHERGHVIHRDLRWRLAVEVLLGFAAPLVAAPLLRRWAQATERIRDRDAAAVVGDPEPVARAMVRMVRLGRGEPSPGLAFVARSDELSRRVEALFAGGPSGQRPARILSTAVLVVITGVVGLAAGTADSLHHALETLLG